MQELPWGPWKLLSMDLLQRHWAHKATMLAQLLHVPYGVLPWHLALAELGWPKGCWVGCLEGTSTEGECLAPPAGQRCPCPQASQRLILHVAHGCLESDV